MGEPNFRLNAGGDPDEDTEEPDDHVDNRESDCCHHDSMHGCVHPVVFVGGGGELVGRQIPSTTAARTPTNR